MIVRGPKLKVVNKLPPLGGKNAETVLVPCCTWKYVPLANFDGVDISEVLPNANS